MSENASFHSPQSYSHLYRQGRRRWVPKGVALLAILFVIGLLGACQSPIQEVAAIAIPVDVTGTEDV
ncbi:MAG: hypothetical protein AB8G18_05890 [Gammaproteobacteria bacterium]